MIIYWPVGFSQLSHSKRDIVKPYSLRIEHPPPVPVTQPKVQNLAHKDGMRLAGWSGSSEVM